MTVLNTPLQTGEYLDANLGLYAQDSWRLNRFTINLGLRYDYVKQHVVGEPAQTGRFANSVAYGDIYLPNWKNFSPRTSVVYDLFGNGKTAIRAGFNKYMTAATTGFAQIYNPTALTTQSLAWTDLNGDDIAQGERGCIYRTRRLRDQLQQPADQLRRPRAVDVRPEPQAAVSARPTTSASRTNCCRARR